MGRAQVQDLPEIQRRLRLVEGGAHFRQIRAQRAVARIHPLREPVRLGPRLVKRAALLIQAEEACRIRGWSGWSAMLAW
jgi:hypothetical protein